MKTKLLGIAALSLVALAVGLLWLMDAKTGEEREAALESGLRGPVNALTQTLQADLRGLRRALPVGTALTRDRLDWGSYKPFFALAQIRLTGGQPQVLQFAADPRGAGAEWTAETLGPWIGSEPLKTVKGGASLAMRMSPERRKVLLALFGEEDKPWVAFAGPEFLQSLIELQKGPKGWMMILNGDGQVLAHSTADYAGTKVSAGSLADQIRGEADARGMRSFEPADSEPQVAAFEKVARTNVVMVAARPSSEMKAERRRLLIYGAVAAAGLLTLTLSGLWALIGRFEDEQEERLRAVRAAAVPAVPPPSTKVEVTGPSPQMLAKERRDSFVRIASALGHELRSPLIAILGFAQMILASTKDERQTQPAESILRETRIARDVVDKLLAFAGDAPGEKKKGRVDTVLARVLTEFETRFGQRHIRVQKHLRDTSEIPMIASGVDRAFRHVLNNAIEAMERMPKKELTIRVTEEPDVVQVEIADNGEGIEPEKLDKVFDPFFSTKNANEHLGMGLPAALGLVREHGGEVRLHSERGKGTTVTMTFPKAAKTVEIAGATVTLKTEQKVEIPASLPASAVSEATVGIDKGTDFDATIIGNAGLPSSAKAEGKRDSPADIDIENLLAMPEEGVAEPEGEDAAAKAEGGSMEMPEGLSFEEVLVAERRPGFDEDKTQVIPSTVPDMVRADGLSRPRFEAPKKESKLDTFRADVRRPGARP